MVHSQSLSHDMFRGFRDAGGKSKLDFRDGDAKSKSSPAPQAVGPSPHCCTALGVSELRTSSSLLPQ